MMNDWYERSMKALQLAGMSKGSQQCYTRAVRMLVEFYDKTPDLISEEDLQEYFLHHGNEGNGVDMIGFRLDLRQ